MKVQIKFTYFCSVTSVIIVNILIATIWFLQHTDNNFLHTAVYQLLTIILINIILILVTAYFISRHSYITLTPKYIEFTELFKKKLYRWSDIKNVKHKILFNFQYLVISTNNNEVFSAPLSCTNYEELKLFLKELDNDNSLKKCILQLEY